MSDVIPTPRLADPTPLGLFGLAIGCAALLPAAFGLEGAFAPAALRTAGWYCLLFGAGCQFLAGILSFFRGNGLGGTLLTTFSFNWVMNAWAMWELSEGRAPDRHVVLAVDLCFLPIFAAMTWAFGWTSKLFFWFLLDIDALYILRIVRELTGIGALSVGVAICTVALLALALYIAIAIVLWEVCGRLVLPIPGPMWKRAATPPG